MADIKTTRLVNRLVLQTLDDLNGIPQTFDEIDDVVSERMARRVTNHTADAIRYLEEAGYIAECRATAADERCWKVTAKGMAQVARAVAEDELDRMIWG